MDSLTQMVLGAAVGEATLGKKVGNRAMMWGAVAGTLPDLDVIANFFMSPIDALAFHRGITHAAIVCLFGALILGWLVHRLYKYEKHKWVAASSWFATGLLLSGSIFFSGGISIGKSVFSVLLLALLGYFIYKRYQRPSYNTDIDATTGDWQRLFWWALITHPILDCFTTYGTQILLPFTDKRVSFDNIAVADPLYTLPLIFGLLLAIRRPANDKMRSVLNWWGLGLSSVYMMFTLVNKQYINHIFTDSLQKQGIEYERFMTTPTILNNVLWSGIAESDSVYYYGQYSLFDSKKEFVLQKISKNHELIEKPLKTDLTLQTLKWFSNGYFHVKVPEPGKLFWFDLRFGSFRLSPQHKDEFVFKFDLDEKNGSYIMNKQANGPRDGDIGAIFSALWNRIKGI
jgi:inner membrane protein